MPRLFQNKQINNKKPKEVEQEGERRKREMEEGKEGGRRREKEEGREKGKEGERKESSALAFSHLRCRDIKFLEKLFLKEGPLIGIGNSARTGSSRKSYAEQMSRC